MLLFVVLLVITLVVAAAVGPPVPEGVTEGDVVDIDGVLYERKGDLLYTLDDDAVQGSVKTMTVTGSRLDQKRKQKIIRADVVDGDDLRETGARTLADVLEEQGGVQVNSSLGLGAEVFVDGLDGRHVLILIDGRPVNGKVNNRVDVSRLPISPGSIERIEIVRGPMSALYGSDALGGVVNIITKKPSGDVGGEAELGAQVLTGGTVWSTAGLHGHGGFGPLALRLDVNGTLLPGYDRGGSLTGKDVPDGKADVPDRRQGSVGVDVGVPLPGGFSLRSTLMGTVAQTSAVVSDAAPFRDAADNSELSMSTTASGGLELGLAQDVDVAADLRVDRFNHVFKKLPTGGLAEAPAFCGGFFDVDACPREPNIRTNAQKDEARLELRADAVFVDDADAATLWGRELSLSLGTVLLQEKATRKNDLDEDTLPGGGERLTASVYGELLWRPLTWLSILPGARLDTFLIDGQVSDGDVDGAAFGPKLAARLDGPLGTGLRASIGRGFRLPSFEERFLRFDHSELGYIVEGNADLLPEQSTGVRAEAVWQTKELWIPVDAGVELGVNVLQDLITEDADSASVDGIPIFTYRNAARAWTAALTTRAKVGPVPVGVGSVRLDLTWQYLLNAVDVSACPDDDPWLCSAAQGATSLPLRPAHSVDATGRFTLRATDTVLFVRADAMSERPLVVDVAPAALILAAGVRQPILQNMEVVVGFENLLDQSDPVFGPKPGRHISIGFRIWED
ncbi:MAG: TonB-dependent receptor [Deltaproteobacteria bacterium]|nr:TonB-dependent receptor [Deltaproteobacteria bacterium]